MAEVVQPGESGFAALYQALLEVTDTISLHDTLDGLLHELVPRLLKVVRFDFIVFTLHDRASNVMRLHHLERDGETTRTVPDWVPVEDSPSGWVWQHQEPLLSKDIRHEPRFGAVMKALIADGIRSIAVLPMTTAHRRLGGLAFLSRQTAAYDEIDLKFLQRVAAQVALAVENVANREEALIFQEQIASERDQLSLVLELNNILVSNLDLHQLFNAISTCLQQVVQHDYVSLMLVEPETQMLHLNSLIFPDGSGLVHEGMVYPLEGAPSGRALAEHRYVLVDPLEEKDFPSDITRKMLAEGVRSACWFPLITPNTVLGTLCLASLHEHGFRQRDVDLLAQVATQVAIAVENALAFKQIAQLRKQLADEKLYLEEEIRSEHNPGTIMGESPALQLIMRQVRTVAPTNASVLILGETGTGKELIARAIHDLSLRRERTFIKLSCAAIPGGLLESELFGHERGAFTGAAMEKMGRLELAHNGTLFLDEVGDLPLELQPKLLRVLQEGEFERLGSTGTQHVDIRLVAATNRNLAEMVNEGTFRRDLFYRLNVFPLRIPPLRERNEDIPILVRYFAKKFSRSMDRNIETIPSGTMQALVRWRWPGNVRELEHLIERAVILSPGPVLCVPVAELKLDSSESEFADRLEQAEREHILRVLREAQGVIGGPKGAAARLGLKRTTLHFKMKKLGIRREELTIS